MKRNILTLLLLLQSCIYAGDESFDVLDGIMDTGKKEINAKQAINSVKDDFSKSKHAKLNKEGYWQFFQASSKAKKGEYCTAVFMKEGMGVSIIGPGGDYKGALMMLFRSDDTPAFPASETMTKIPVTLKQGSDAPVNIKALNYTIGSWKTPVVVFAVPTIDAAMEGMDDKLDFHLQYEGQKIVDVEWHSGKIARDELKKCLAGKAFNTKNPTK